MRNFLPHKKNGFALIEALVAILILSIVITAGFSAIATSTTTISGIKDEMIANQLANEALEMVHNLKDNQYDMWAQGDMSLPPSWPSFYWWDECRTTGDSSNMHDCAITFSDLVSSADSSALGSGFPGIEILPAYDASTEANSDICVSNTDIVEADGGSCTTGKMFKRKITLDPDVRASTSDEVQSKKITVTVTWPARGGDKTLTVSSFIFR